MSSRHPIQTSHQHKLYCVFARSKGNCCSVGNRPTRFVPLWSVQIESPISTLSPREKGREEPFAMADATADLRKSIVGVTWVIWPDGLAAFVHEILLPANGQKRVG